MLDFINNEWVVAIVGAIVSGVILVPITYKITKILEKTKIPAEVKKCNKEILSILRRIVSEGEEVSFSTIEVLIDSISRANDLDKELINTPKMFIQDLILDIYDSSYIPMNSKIDMTSKLQILLESDTRITKTPKKVRLQKGETIILSTAAIVSITSIGVVLFSIFNLFIKNGELNSSNANNSNIFLDISLILALFTLMMTSIFSIKESKISRRIISAFFGFSDKDDDKK